MTLADFLGRDETLAQLRRDIVAGSCVDRRPLAAEMALIALLTARWTAGLSGWLTRAEAEQLAAERDSAPCQIRDSRQVHGGAKRSQASVSATWHGAVLLCQIRVCEASSGYLARGFDSQP